MPRRLSFAFAACQELSAILIRELRHIAAATRAMRGSRYCYAMLSMLRMRLTTNLMMICLMPARCFYAIMSDAPHTNDHELY